MERRPPVSEERWGISRQRVVQQMRLCNGSSKRGRVWFPKSLSENCEGPCGEGFWRVPRRRGPRIPATGCKDRANDGRRQKTRRPAGFRGKGRLASLLLSRRPVKGILVRRALPSNLSHKNRTPRNFQTGSKVFRLNRQNSCAKLVARYSFVTFTDLVGNVFLFPDNPEFHL